MNLPNLPGDMIAATEQQQLNQCIQHLQLNCAVGISLLYTYSAALATSLLPVVHLRVAHRLPARVQDGVHPQPPILAQLKLICAAAAIRLWPLILQQDGSFARATR
jgi:hypothetical protein